MNRRKISLYAVTMAFTALLMISDVQELYSDDLSLSKTCSNATLNGSYGSYSSGDTVDGPLARVGIVTFDGNGNMTFKNHSSRNGKFESSKGSGRYEVNPDCSYKLLRENGSQAVWGVIVDDGNTIFTLNRTSGNVVNGVVRKIHTK